MAVHRDETVADGNDLRRAHPRGRDASAGSGGAFEPAASPTSPRPGVWFARVGAITNHFRGGVSVRRPVHFILDRGEEFLRGLGRRRVVDAGGVDFEDLAPEFLFRRTDIV